MAKPTAGKFQLNQIMGEFSNACQWIKYSMLIPKVRLSQPSEAGLWLSHSPLQQAQGPGLNPSPVQ
ncbi:rCG43128 [Rattus norvegicus]|uniref:RCG43128 n=1 Tax=Rattus norvegicus TaxID=10116 RepID=A6IWB8_RAT|nr:rCG43128 [Rattus norvegicus]